MPERTAPTIARPSAEILIVEDDLSISQALTELLKIEGHPVRIAYNGREGIQALGSCHPKLILLDLMMPVMSGWDFLRELRQDPRASSIPVIVMSAVDPSMGHIDEPTPTYIPKPIDVDVLLKHVARICR